MGTDEPCPAGHDGSFCRLHFLFLMGLPIVSFPNLKFGVIKASAL